MPHHVVRHLAVQKNGDPPFFVHIKAGDDIRVFRAHQLGKARLTLQRQQLAAVIALVFFSRLAGRRKELAAHLVAEPAPFQLIVLHAAPLIQQIAVQPLIFVHRLSPPLADVPPY